MREAQVSRKTKETDIDLSIKIDGKGTADINTGIGFFDHMLSGFAKHGFFDLALNCEGDLNVDGHHSVEDAGIVLGTAIREALEDKKGIKRYGKSLLPMDDSLCLCAIDLSGRPYLCYDCELTVEKVGYLDTELIKEFFYAVSYSAGMNLHIKMMYGSNNHHMIEAMFKAFAKALDEASSPEPRSKEVISTKGSL